MSPRRIAAALAVATVALLGLTGCVELDSTVSVNPDGKTAEIVSTTSVAKSMAAALATFGEEDTDIDATNLDGACEILNSQMELAAETGELDADSPLPERWVEDGNRCVSVSTAEVVYNESGIQEMKMDGAVLEDESLFPYTIKKLGGSTLVATDIAKDLGSESLDLAYLDGLSITVSFPADVEKANFDGTISEDGKTVSWDLEAIKKAKEAGATLEATGSLGGANTALIIGGVAVAILLVGGVVFLLLRKKNQPEPDGSIADEAAAPSSTEPSVATSTTAEDDSTESESQLPRPDTRI